jgi:hypothetical protein
VVRIGKESASPSDRLAAPARLACPVEPAGAPATYRIVATFAGVHDDSMAVLAASEGGQPIACATGSRTRIQGEEGGDTLVCAFTLAAAAGARSINVQFVWYHADPATFALTRD